MTLFMARLFALIALLISLPLKASTSPEDNPFFYHFAQGDPYLIQRVGIFKPKQNQDAALNTFFQIPIFRSETGGVFNTTEAFSHFAPNVTLDYLTLQTKLRLRYSAPAVFKPFLTAGYVTTRGVDRILDLQGATFGFGTELFLQTDWFTSPSFYSYVEGGALLVNRAPSERAYVNSRFLLSLGRFRLSRNENLARIHLTVDGKFDFEPYLKKPGEARGFFAEWGPKVGLLFPNQHEFSVEWHVQYNRGFTFSNFPNVPKVAHYLGLQVEAPLVGNKISSDSGLSEYRYSPALRLSITGAGGAHQLALNEEQLNYIIPLFIHEKFLIQIDTNYTQSDYFREGSDPNLYFFNSGLRFLLLHPSDRKEEEAPFWGAAGYFAHRSEHFTNEAIREFRGNPEAIQGEITSPYWQETVFNTHRSDWFDFVSARVAVNQFIFRNNGNDPVRAQANPSIRPGLLIHYLKFEKSFFYLRGEKSFLSTDLVDWRAETGWRHRTWGLFVRGENLKVSPSFVRDRIDVYGGFKLYFSMDS